MKWTDVRKKAADMEPAEAAAWLRSLGDAYGKQTTKLADTYYRRVRRMEQELIRLATMQELESALHLQGYPHVGGVDEAGRGPLAGPVVAACVILPDRVVLEKLNDSKKLSAAVRDRLFDEIKEKAIAWGIGICDEQYIDRVNILNATRQAMITAVNAMKVKADALIIDAVKLQLPVHQISIPKADETSLAVAAASVLAKVTRDRMMEKLDIEFPAYGFVRNKGYGTEEHVAAIREYGLTRVHRRSFTGNFV